MTEQNIRPSLYRSCLNLPHLLAVDDPLVTLLLGLGFDSSDVRPSSWLGDAVRTNNRLLEPQK